MIESETYISGVIPKVDVWDNFPVELVSLAALTSILSEMMMAEVLRSGLPRSGGCLRQHADGKLVCGGEEKDIFTSR